MHLLLPCNKSVIADRVCTVGNLPQVGKEVEDGCECVSCVWKGREEYVRQVMVIVVTKKN